MIVAIFGYKGCGKSAAADAFIQQGFVQKFFAKPLKDMLQAGLGLTDEQLYGSEKEVPCEELGGKTPRFAMETLGTEWGRDTIFQDIWVRRFTKLAAYNKHVVCEDLRFPNEARVLSDFGAWLIKLVRPGVNRTSEHESEAWVDLLPYHHLIVNDGSLEDLESKVSEFLTAHPNTSDPQSHGMWPHPEQGVCSGPMRDRINELLTHKDVAHAQNRSQT